jgi:hypothetical protein
MYFYFDSRKAQIKEKQEKEEEKGIKEGKVQE